MAMNKARYNQKNLAKEDEEWAATGVSISDDISIPCLNFWNANEREFWRPSFANEIDSLKSQLAAAECESNQSTQN